MADRLGQILAAKAGVDPPRSPEDLSLPRIRLIVRDHFAMNVLLGALSGPVLVRLEHEASDTDRGTWFDGEVTAAETAGGAHVVVEHAEVDAMDERLALLLLGAVPALGLWALDRDGVLLFRHPGGRVDVLADTVTSLAALADRCRELLVDPPAATDPAVVCSVLACDVRWGAMSPTSPTVRHCSGCDRDVHLVTTPDELRRRAREGHCVAVPRGAIANAFPGLLPDGERVIAGAALIDVRHDPSPLDPPPVKVGPWTRLLRAIRGRDET